MDSAALRRFVETHRLFAKAIEGHLCRLWCRPLTPDEENTIRSYTLCGSFMSLESMERGLSFARQPEEAAGTYSLMQAETAQRAAGVVREIQQRLRLGSGAPKSSAFPNLLAWEEALLESMA